MGDYIPTDFIIPELEFNKNVSYLPSEIEDSPYKTYSTFSGADIMAYIPFRKNDGSVSVIPFAELQTLSYSVHRATKNIYGLGNQNPIGVTQGQRTIAGSLIFYKFHMNAIDKLYNALGVDSILLDQLPLFNIMIIIGNEYGSRKYVGIYGVKLITEGLVASIQDLTSETTCQYIAMDIEPMRNIKEDEIIESFYMTNEYGVSFYQSSIAINDILKTDQYNSNLRTNPVLEARKNLSKLK